MNNKRPFSEGIIFTLSDYFFWFLLGNIFFWIMNIPYLFVAITMTGNIQINVILILSLIPMGPALTALLSVMGKITRDGDIKLTKHFFKAYKESLFDSLFFWTLGLVILFVIKIDMILIISNSYLWFINVFLKIIAVICLSLEFYIFPIISRFHLKKKDVIKLSFEYLIKKFYMCVIAFGVIYFLWMISNKEFQAVMILFSVSIITYVIMYLQKGVLKEIEDRLNMKNKTNSK
ncbi:DUF624 domain-containing protein [Clostridium estertheticum]|uniref:DUF624 domain-containing protein n=1 Tax=Clostridium estertheticum TaxID=238834 RepID=UPI001C7CFE08|nr:DUF624 domain-containing protein [Clostridium estertheticum]MBX4271485.1 DUF624 domain-containing protein [Clostridium estertheticum]WLC81037.1 DUF624 domain-containing protein [Clostridium estertheticum]